MAPRQVKQGARRCGRQSNVKSPTRQDRHDIQQEQPRRSHRLQEKKRRDQQPESGHSHRTLYATSQTSDTETRQYPPVSARPRASHRKRKPSSDSLHYSQPREIEPPIRQDEDEADGKQVRISPVPKRPASDISTSNPTVRHWIQKGTWPPDCFEPDLEMVRRLAQKRSTTSASCSEHAKTSTVTSFRPGKPLAVRSRQYELILSSAGIHQDPLEPDLPVTNLNKDLIRELLSTEQPVPEDSLFQDGLFKSTCADIRNRNEARVIREISLLITPSPEQLARRGATRLRPLIESHDERWTDCIPLVKGSVPQPDFSVGLKPAAALTSDQLKKLRPHIGDWPSASRFVATAQMVFPFLVAEVKCGNEALNIADRQNAHSASVAVNAVVELYRAVSRQDELHQRILAFSISHDHRSVRIHGHYALINGQDTAFYRHEIAFIDIQTQDGKDRWAAYKFTRNVYDTFVPMHLERIRSAVDQLPDSEVFSVASLSLSSDVELAAPQDDQSAPCSRGGASELPSPQTASEPVSKKARRNGKMV